MKLKYRLAFLIVSIIPFCGFGQDHYPEVYATMAAYHHYHPVNPDDTTRLDSVKYLNYVFYSSKPAKFPNLKGYKNLEVAMLWGGPKKLYVGEEIEEVSNLRWVDFSFHEKIIYSSKVDSLPKLEVIKLSDSKPVAKLPAFIYNSANLAYIYAYVKNNKGVDFVKLQKLKKLEYLELVVKHMDALPQGVSGLTSLKYLVVLSHHNFKVDSGLANLTGLKFLSLDKDLDDDLLAVLEKMPNLEGLNLNGVNLKNINDIKKLSHLKHLFFWNFNEGKKLEEQKKLISAIFTLLPGTKNEYW